MGIGALSSIAAASTVSPAIGVSLMNGAAQLEKVQADILMASLGVGNNVNTYA